MAKMSLKAKLKLAKAGLWFAKHYPKLALAAALAGAGHYVKTYFDLQHQNLTELKANVAELRKQNQAIVEANQALSADMKVIKQGTEHFNQRIAEINKNTKELERKFNTREFKKLTQEDLPKAEKEFNNWFDSYMEGFNDNTIEFFSK